MAQVVYILGALTSLACAVLLLRRYADSKQPLLLWSGLCFVGLAAANALIFVDLVIFPTVDLYRVRLTTAAVSMAMLLYGLIWESK
jgi:hypothetical protein